MRKKEKPPKKTAAVLAKALIICEIIKILLEITEKLIDRLST